MVDSERSNGPSWGQGEVDLRGVEQVGQKRRAVETQVLLPPPFEEEEGGRDKGGGGGAR